MKKLFLCLVVVVSVFNSCKNDDESVCNHVLEHTTLEEQYACSNTIYDMDVDWEAINNQHLLIRNQAQFEEFISGNCMPQIDFSKYDLVITLMVVSDVQSVEYSVIQLCNQNVTIGIHIEDKGNDVNLGTFHVLIPKLKENETLESVFFTS